MEVYIAKMATVVNQMKKGSAGRVREAQAAKKDEEREFTLFPDLPAELRLKIWAFCYILPQRPRIVEVRTQKHAHCPGHEGFCPRYSPTRKHPLVNTCHEARAAAYSEAHKAGHLVFSSSTGTAPSPPGAGRPIIFNPASDLLYLPTESLPLPLTRGPRGTYTQYKKCQSQSQSQFQSQLQSQLPSGLRFLAIGLERHGTQFNPMRCAIHDFPHLEELLLVAPDRARARDVSGLEENLRVMQGAWERRAQTAMRFLSAGQKGGVAAVAGTAAAVVERRWPRVRVVVKCGGAGLEVVEG